MERKKYIFLGMISLCSISLAGCGRTQQAAYEKYGYNSRVIYDLGDGVYDPDARNAHEIVMQYPADSYITDFSNDSKYNFVLLDHEFEGWYFDESFEQPVDFTVFKTTENSEITLYAKWREKLERYFTIYYYDEETQQNVLLKQATWEKDTRYNFTRAEIEHPSDEVYTYINSYTDPEMTTLVTDSYVITGDDVTLPIYTKWVKGDFAIVRTEREFINSIGMRNIYLDADIDFRNRTGPYTLSLNNKTILGNNHKLSNIAYTTYGKENNSKQMVTLGILAQDMTDSTIKDLVIENISCTMRAVTCSHLCFAAIVGTAVNSTIENVTVTGTVTYDEATEERLGENLRVKLTDAVYRYNAEDNVTISNCSINLTYDKGE